MLEIYSKIINYYLWLVYKIMLILMFLLIFALGVQIGGRYIVFIPRYLWTIELSNFCLIWLIFLGSIIGVKEKRHFYMDIFYNTKLTPFLEIIFQVVYYSILISIAFIFIIFGYSFYKIGLLQTSELTGLNLGIIYVSVPVTGISWLLVLLREISDRYFFKKRTYVK